MKVGIPTIILVMLAGFLPSLYLYFFHGVELSFSEMAKAAVAIWIVYGAFYPIEPLTFYPSLGMAGTYLSWVSGNTGPMRVPSAMIAKEACNVKEGSREAEICTIMSIAGSVFCNIVILFIGVIVGGQIIDMLPPIVTDALNTYLLPGIFGGMLGMVGNKYLKITIPWFILVIFLCYLSGAGYIPSAFVLLIAVVGVIIYARILYKKGLI